MKKRTRGQYHIARGIKLIACLSALAGFMIALPQAAYAQNLTPPPVPDRIKVPEGNEVYFIGHAFGTQDYACAPSGAGVAFVLTTPEAVLFDNPARRVVNHYFSPNPVERGMVRPTWQSTRDSSIFWGQGTGTATFQSDPDFVAPDAIAWVRLARAGVLDGVGGGNTLSVATFVQRVNTVGGLAPSSGCNSADDIGHTAFVPYEADYVFFTSPTATAGLADRQ